MLKEDRLARGWSQEYLSAHLGVTREYIQMIETGKRKPSFDVLIKLEDLFEKDYRKLFNLPDRGE